MIHFFAALPAAALGSATILGLSASTAIGLTVIATITALTCTGIARAIRKDGK